MDSPGLGGRLPLQPPASLGPEARALYDRLAGGRLGSASPFTSRTDAGELIGPFNALLHAPAIGGGFIDFHEAEEQATPLSKRMREIVILSVGAAWGSAYELYAHRAVAAQVGFSPNAVAALGAGEPCDQLAGDEQAAQRFTLELARHRVVSDATYGEAEQMFGREGLVALTLLAAAYTGTCMMLNAFAVPPPSN
ncbi:carboxymuconolactone decarboxylase family protein [Sphingomonas sp. CROZ-RG-20F-R02-07]|uniref:carboxymuconolactone decarboxylase family protein n=1 Tax=Sphingomonas sp. CROZ-RG-20F-R02-07 TaxID=2914832 RepID=UPI001F5AC805|nr:carboxymuconolactone decarboxylase family protein [Sphingomonas sp. CROZ-RG-20F-R02-07]